MFSKWFNPLGESFKSDIFFYWIEIFKNKMEKIVEHLIYWTILWVYELLMKWHYKKWRKTKETIEKYLNGVCKTTCIWLQRLQIWLLHIFNVLSIKPLLYLSIIEIAVRRDRLFSYAFDVRLFFIVTLFPHTVYCDYRNGMLSLHIIPICLPLNRLEWIFDKEKTHSLYNQN